MLWTIVQYFSIRWQHAGHKWWLIWCVTSDPSVFQSSLAIAGWVCFFMSWKIPRFSGDIMSPKCLHKCWFCPYRVRINVDFLRKYEYLLTFFVWNRIKYPDEKKCISHVILLGIGYEDWLIFDSEDASKKTCGYRDFSIWLWALHRWTLRSLGQ